MRIRDNVRVGLCSLVAFGSVQFAFGRQEVSTLHNLSSEDSQSMAKDILQAHLEHQKAWEVGGLEGPVKIVVKHSRFAIPLGSDELREDLDAKMSAWRSALGSGESSVTYEQACMVLESWREKAEGHSDYEFFSRDMEVVRDGDDASELVRFDQGLVMSRMVKGVTAYSWSTGTKTVVIDARSPQFSGDIYREQRLYHPLGIGADYHGWNQPELWESSVVGSRWWLKCTDEKLPGHALALAGRDGSLFPDTWMLVNPPVERRYFLITFYDGIPRALRSEKGPQEERSICFDTMARPGFLMIDRIDATSESVEAGPPMGLSVDFGKVEGLHDLVTGVKYGEDVAQWPKECIDILRAL